MRDRPRAQRLRNDILRLTATPRAANLAAVLFWTVLWAATFFTLLTGQERLGISDLVEQFHAFAIFQAREWGAGRLPLWSDGSYGGFPFAADPQSGSFYLPRWVTILLGGRGELSFYALQLEALLHIWLAGVCTFFFAQRETNSRPAALLAAVSFGLGGYLVGYPVLQLAVLETIVWLPLVLACVRRLTDAGSDLARQRWAAATALALALSCTAGHPQTFTHLVYLSSAYYFWRSSQAGWAWRRRIGYGLLLGLIAAALAAPTWLPAVRYALASTRGAVSYAFTAAGLPLVDYMQAVLPNTLSLWVPQYGGMVALLLLLLALQLGGREVRFWGLAALLAAWLALGDRGVLFEVAYRLLPGATLFRQQERWLSIFSFAMVMLAAHGAAALPRVSRRELWRSMALAGALLGAGAIFLALAPGLRAADWSAAVGRQLIVGLLGVGALWLLWRRPVLWPLVLCLAAGDLYLATAPGFGRVAGAPSGFWPEPAWVDDLRESNSRIDTSGIFWANFGEVFGVSDTGGISPLKPEGLAALETLPVTRRWQLLGTTHVIGGALPEGVAGVALQEVDDVRPGVDAPAGTLYALTDPTPYARVVFAAVAEPDRAAALALLGDAAFDPLRQVVLPSPIDLPAPAAGAAATVQIVAERPDRLDLLVDSSAEGILVVSHWYFPGWRVSRNGEEVPLLAANHVQQGVLLPAGRSEVTFAYRPLAVYVGGALALLALLGVGVLLLFSVPRLDWTLRWSGRGKLPAFNPGARAARFVLHGRRDALQASLARLRALDPRVYFVILLLLAGAVRLQTAATQDLRGDEAFSVVITDGPATNIIEQMMRSNDPHPPLHYFLVKGWRALGGDSPLALRVTSIWLSLLLLALTARLGFDLGGRRIGLLAAALLAVSQSQIWIGHDARNQYLLALCMTLWAALLLWRRRSWWLYGLVAALTVYSHYFGIFGLLAQGVFLWTAPQRRADRGRWIAAGAGAALLFLPWLLAVLRRTVATQLAEPAAIDLGEHLVRVGAELTVGGALPGGSRRWLFLLALGLALWGARHWPDARRADRRGVGVWLLSWLGFTALGLFMIRLNRSIYNDFYAVMAAPAMWLLVAAGLSALLQPARGSRGSRPPHGRAQLLPYAGAAALLLLLGANVLSTRNYLADTSTYGRDRGYRALAAQLADASQPDDLILYHAPDPSLGYYLRDLPQDRDLVPAVFGMDEEAINGATAAGVAPYPRVWFIPAQNNISDPGNAVTRWLDYHLLHEQYYQFDSLALRAYRPVSTAPVVAALVDVRWADALDLQAVYLTRNGRPVDFNGPLDLRSGDELAVTLLWQAQQPVQASYVVFVHLVDEGGQLAGQHDGIPLFGTRPTDSWRRGEALLDRHTLTIDAARETSAQLLVGLYDAQTVERLDSATGANSIPLFAQPIRVYPPAE